MKFPKKHLVVGLIGNLLTLIVGAIGLTLFALDKGDKADLFAYFTVISNIFVVAMSFINAIVYTVSIAKNKNYVCEFLQVVKMISVVSVAITFTMVLIFLLPANPNYGFYEGSKLFLHVIIPVTAVFSFLFLEYSTKIRFRFFFTPIIFVFAYGVFYVLYAFLAPAGKAVDWYGFMFEATNRIAPVDVSKFQFAKFFIFLGESFGGSLVFGFVFWLVNKISNLIFIGYVMDEPQSEYYDEIEEPINVQKEHIEVITPEKTKTTSTKAKKASSVPASKKYKDGARVYHIARSKFVSKHWQVKLAGGEKAIKIFDTQLEAINYAKKLVKTQGGSIRIHSMKGQLRK